MIIHISVGDPCISPVNHLFCGRNHEENETETGPSLGPALVRFPDAAANAHAHARNAHEEQVETSKPSHCVDDAARGRGRDDLDHNRRDPYHVDRHPCEGVAAMASGCHRACHAASPDEGGVVVMVTDCHLAHGGANPALDDGVVSTSDDESGGRGSHLTDQNRCRNLTMYRQRTNPMSCQKPKIRPRPLTSRDVAP
jgi:hypothetical protein